MNTASPPAEAIRAVLRESTGGIAGLVDDLLTACREHGLELDCQAGRWRVRSSAAGWHELGDVPLRKSVFRAVLARLATLCNEQRPDSCSPYGGQGEIRVGSNPPMVFRVAFTNTPDEQRLQLTPDRPARSIGGGIMTAPLVSEGDAMLAGLLAETPRLRSELPGWTVGHLVPALAAFHDDATDNQIATALSKLREVLRQRADVDPWLGAIANLGAGEYAGDPRAWPSTSQYRESIPLARRPGDNRTYIVDQARRLRESLLPPATNEGSQNTQVPPSGPDAKS